MLNNERCFLEEEAWKGVFRSSIIKSSLISDRSEIVISMLILKASIPGLFVDVTDFICVETDPNVQAIKETESQARQLRLDLRKWRGDWETILTRCPDVRLDLIEYDKQCKDFAVYLSCVIITNRLLAAVSSSERLELEFETQCLCHEMLDLEMEVKSLSSHSSLFMAQTVGVARATIATARDWRLIDETDSNPTGLVDVWKFEKWCRLFGRKLS